MLLGEFPYRAGLFGVPAPTLSSSLPQLLPGLSIRQVLLTPDGITIVADLKPRSAPCPDCGRRSMRRHSHYLRTLADLPLQGRVARLQVRVRRFRCDTAGCRRRIFAERLPDIAAVKARRAYSDEVAQ